MKITFPNRGTKHGSPTTPSECHLELIFVSTSYFTTSVKGAGTEGAPAIK